MVSWVLGCRTLGAKMEAMVGESSEDLRTMARLWQLQAKMDSVAGGSNYSSRRERVESACRWEGGGWGAACAGVARRGLWRRDDQVPGCLEGGGHQGHLGAGEPGERF